jgi:hypothetical protein
MLNIIMLIVHWVWLHGYPWISGYPVDLDLERHPCPWILKWAGQDKADGFGFGFGFTISDKTRPIAIPKQNCRYKTRGQQTSGLL